MPRSCRVAEPLFSIVTPSYQQGRFIERTIQSVLSQESESLELLVMDGGSTDETVPILERYSDPLTWRSGPDDGQADAVNLGLARARGQIIGWLNSDDVYYAGALAAVACFFADHPEVDVVSGDADHIDENGRFLERYPTEPWDPERLTETCFVCQPATFFRRRVVERWGELDSGLHFCMDYEYWLRLQQSGARFAYLRRRLAGSRLHSETKTLGQRVAVHTEINHMMRRTCGRCPDRWLTNWAIVMLQRWGVKSSRGHHLGVAWLSWLAALRWNRSVSQEHRRSIGTWLRAASRRTSAPVGGNRARPRPRANLPRRLADLRIGFDVSQTGPSKAGCGWFAEGLLTSVSAAMADPTWLLYRTFGDHFWDPSGPPSVERFLRPNVRAGLHHPSPQEMREFWRQPPADFEHRLGAPDIVHANNFFAPRYLAQARLVYTLYDLLFLHRPELTSEANRLGCYSGVVSACQHADLIVAISEHSRRDFLDTFPSYPADRVAVVYPTNRFAGWAPSDAVPLQLATVEAWLPRAGFWLSVGDWGPRKNLGRILEAYARHRLRAREARVLVLVGGGGLDPELAARLTELGLTDHVLHLGYVDDPALSWLYENAFAFLFPSLAEGFGMPVVEAMGYGVPVLTSDLEIFREVVGHAALRVDPTDPSAIAAGMDRLSNKPDLHTTLRALGRVRARRFESQKSATALLALYEAVVSRPKYLGEGLQAGDPVPVAMAGVDPGRWSQPVTELRSAFSVLKPSA